MPGSSTRGNFRKMVAPVVSGQELSIYIGRLSMVGGSAGARTLYLGVSSPVTPVPRRRKLYVSKPHEIISREHVAHQRMQEGNPNALT